MLLVIGILFAVVGIAVEWSPMATVFHGYSEFRNATITCPKCAWSGQGRQLHLAPAVYPSEDSQSCGAGRCRDSMARIWRPNRSMALCAES